MFSDVVSNQTGVASGFRRDSTKPGISHDPRSIVAQIMLALAKRRNNDQTPTADQAAGFKEGERSPIAGASL